MLFLFWDFFFNTTYIVSTHLCRLGVLLCRDWKYHTIYTRKLQMRKLHMRKLYMRKIYTRKLYMRKLHMRELYTRKLHMRKRHMRELYTSKLHALCIFFNISWHYSYVNESKMAEEYNFSSKCAYCS